jgi:hypothetical protein
MSCWEVTGQGVDDEGYSIGPVYLTFKADTFRFEPHHLPPIADGEAGQNVYEMIVDGSRRYGYYLGSGATARNLPLQDCAPEGYDCINGKCQDKDLFKTGGKYSNLAACKANCEDKVGCDGECVSAAEIAALQQAANRIKSKLCG